MNDSMLPKKIIGRYKGSDPTGITIGHITFKPNVSVECSVDNAEYEKIMTLTSSDNFDLFEFVSTKEIGEVETKLSTAKDELESKLNVVREEIDVSKVSFDKLNQQVQTMSDYMNEEINASKLAFDKLNQEVQTISSDIKEINVGLDKTNNEVSEALLTIKTMIDELGSILNLVNDLESKHNEDINDIRDRLLKLEQI